jgi:CheY-like chemotaxis protein
MQSDAIGLVLQMVFEREDRRPAYLSKGRGIDSVSFQDGRAALQELASRRPDAIVLDPRMPSFDGLQVLDASQRLPARRGGAGLQRRVTAKVRPGHGILRQLQPTVTS